MGFVQRRILKGVLWVVRHPKLTLGIALGVLALAVLDARLRLTVSTERRVMQLRNVPARGRLHLQRGLR